MEKKERFKKENKLEGLTEDVKRREPLKTLTLDVARYEHLLEDDSLTEDQKRQFLEAMWSIIVSFVDLGFAVHPVQQACGQNPKSGADGPLPAQGAVEWMEQIQPKDISNTAEAPQAARRERTEP